mmetsp:Transcript_71615/g.185963  ORF Transcript_71615/g.185963 Transcript_71615/m.185963 type:complete len:270 (+) Transcript_71615:3233-4042(+)
MTVAADELLEEHARGESRLPNAHGLEDTAAIELVHHQLGSKLLWHFLRIGLNAANEVWLCLAQLLHQARKRLSKVGAHCLRCFLTAAAAPTCSGSLREVGGDDITNVFHNAVRRGLEQLRGLIRRFVHVLLKEALEGVGDLSCKVSNAESRARKLRLHKARVLFVGLGDLRRVGGVRSPGNSELFVEHGQDAALRIDQRDDIRVVLEVHAAIEADPFGLVILQLHLEDVVVEVVLQMLVAQVDEQLLQGVRLEALEACNVEHAEEAACG